MGAHGFFSPKHPYRPYIIGFFSHWSIKSCPVKFLIDTGADKTYISPDWQTILRIPRKHRHRYHTKMISIAGLVEMDCVEDCSITFSKGVSTSEAYKVSNLSVLMAAAVVSKKKPLTGKGLIPCILGRDVLDHLSLGFCKKAEYLFVTGRTNDYCQALNRQFPTP